MGQRSSNTFILNKKNMFTHFLLLMIYGILILTNLEQFNVSLKREYYNAWLFCTINVVVYIFEFIMMGHMIVFVKFSYCQW